MSKIWVEIASARRSRGSVMSSTAAKTAAVPSKLRVFSVYILSYTRARPPVHVFHAIYSYPRIGSGRYIFGFVRVSFACVFVVAVDKYFGIVVLCAYVRSCCARRSG
jgi:hypothetical protein